MQVRLQQPADLQASVSLRSEQDGFTSRSVANMLRQLFAKVDYAASTDEVYLQDAWHGPTNLKDRILLFLGDPLMTVEVPWTPESLIQNWAVDI